MKKNKIKFLISISVVIFFMLFFYNVVDSANLSDALGKVNNNIAPKTGIEQRDVSVVIASVIKALIFASGIIFFALIIYSGIYWMISRGEEGKIEKSQKTLTEAVIGLVLIISAYAITNLIQTRIIEGQMLNTDSGFSSQNLQEESKIGCCVDWVSGSTVAQGNWLNLSIPTSRITSFSDCKDWGEKEGQGDVWYCAGPKEGCWTFTEGITDLGVCNQIRDSYAYVRSN